MLRTGQDCFGYNSNRFVSVIKGFVNSVIDIHLCIDILIAYELSRSATLKH